MKDEFDSFMDELRKNHPRKAQEPPKKEPTNDPIKAIQYAYADNINKSELLREKIMIGSKGDMSERDMLLLATECISTMINDKGVFHKIVKERICSR